MSKKESIGSQTGKKDMSAKALATLRSHADIVGNNSGTDTAGATATSGTGTVNLGIGMPSAKYDIIFT
ncbi:MAG: hypothetical protein A3C06_03120 [Candidatus Taylorbacteria bacterium RIFCSPHIGHO2_02_FULL_46_13]|uniref:Uncharacterized protein n=1 Tax=Candidatus Taylorbacteria bacterium RIFCSPHIGHO2_02_FULL_46_13 TaxID=1802312 RepID=A0A1G2MUC3_9BACT|nr:MAG: hypothetical protein A3C06_03120 [Candidatus Taylorbacteria bacterium RIFCSPHIGHO2_02_FULL_46_13]